MTNLWWCCTLASAGNTLSWPIWPAAPTMLMKTDSCRLGWGVVLNRTATAWGHHAPERAELFINCLELGAIRLELLSFRHLLPFSGFVLRLKCDFQVTLGVLLAQSSPSVALRAEYRLLRTVLDALHVDLRHEIVPSALNI